MQLFNNYKYKPEKNVVLRDCIAELFLFITILLKYLK